MQTSSGSAAPAAFFRYAGVRMRLRTVTEPDIDEATDAAIRRLQQRAFPATEKFRRSRQYIHQPRPGDVRILAVDDGRLIGQTVLYWATAEQGRLACLGNVCSDPGRREGGIASACVRRAIDLARKRGVDWVMLFCRSQFTGFYAKLGFEAVAHQVWHTRPDGTTYAHWRDDVCMVLALSGASWPTNKLLLDIEDF